ncbi:AAA family ATPase [Gilvimarinus agarilyticus]|uniref:gluconokinase n=1 Tax=unclassified Gilvimarinus TaxID=2642066 RepID=UPI001C0A6265|nr:MULTISPECIES: gluconokinase, GntK/IdnK-type [unclassified Gilvimarinus]MBU2886218.1 AAA family ATPase [Gilvimarinus agarilyticus]MDO6570906.1 gluconokinase, GntK/IdnK-type [Gilvimarinus sp. 2_MG-2023]MDO6747807.1 gluconokinase, GntK/IdnK-type [Gilvimarinus sp. 1_MG-2023]
MIYIICGVSGTGKSTIGRLLAKEKEIPFFDADDFHPISNVNKMKSGTPLTDADREPWLEELSILLQRQEQEGSAVLACSALKERYRETLSRRCQKPVAWAVLHGDAETISLRIDSREDHYFTSDLLRSQLRDFELPQYGLVLDIRRSPNQIVDTIIETYT